MNCEQINPFFSQESHSLYCLSAVFFGPMGTILNYQISLFTEELLKIALSSFCASALLMIPYLIACNKMTQLQRINQHRPTSFSLGLADLIVILSLPFASSILASIFFDLAFAPIMFNQLLGLGSMLALKLASQAIFSILERQQNKNNFPNTLNLCTKIQ